MVKNEKGTVLFFVLFLSTLIMIQLTGSMTFLVNTRTVMVNDMKKLQARSCAEAGVWLAIEKWENEADGQLGFIASLSEGITSVSLRVRDDQYLEIRSEGRVPPYYRDRLLVYYDIENQKITKWNRERGNF
ncbi:hypothetical protein EIZ39_05690 [Ammoniphilus sp. CFH 90114]|nr:hypothetical protein [Ammoniphilus sp. CFH 90114]RXT13643.1 hypothetical protein EIZ39_05690 [Ammoniphilus sp. CFH 90114]